MPEKIFKKMGFKFGTTLVTGMLQSQTPTDVKPLWIVHVKIIVNLKSGVGHMDTWVMLASLVVHTATHSLEWCGCQSRS